jgi:hypothetical protein
VRPWTLSRFQERLEAWAKLESPTDDLCNIVTHWLETRGDDPYQGAVKREEGIHSLWFGRVPNSHDGYGHVVICTYWIYESTRNVHCHNFSTLSLPL